MQIVEFSKRVIRRVLRANQLYLLSGKKEWERKLNVAGINYSWENSGYDGTYCQNDMPLFKFVTKIKLV